MRGKMGLIGTVIVAVILSVAGPGLAGGGKVLPAGATVRGYSLVDMAKAIAPFSASGNAAAQYPNTPFQILYTSNTNSFTVDTGTMFFVPLAWSDDSPPVLGDFPQNQVQAGDYWFGDSEVGFDVAEIEVDGQVTELGPQYAAVVPAPGLPDGGNHFTQVGAFLTPLTKGTHTVTIRFRADGDAIPPFNLIVFEEFGFVFAPGNVWQFETSFTVTVR